MEEMEGVFFFFMRVGDEGVEEREEKQIILCEKEEISNESL